MNTETTVGQALLTASRHRLADCVRKIKHCLGQLTDEQVGWRPRESHHSIGNLILHLCGNLRQWLVAGAGGAPDVRDRPREFSERGPWPRAELLRRLDEVVAQADAVLARLTDAQLLERRRIQGFDLTVLAAILDSVPHFAGHTQEIVCLTRLQLGEAYRFDWVPQTKEQGAL